MSAGKLSLVLLLCGLCAIAFAQNPNGMNVAGSEQVHNGRVGEPHFGLNGGGAGNNARNYGAGLDGSFGTKVWESQNGRHSVGVGGTYGNDFGRNQGRSWRGQDRWSAGAGYRFRF